MKRALAILQFVLCLAMPAFAQIAKLVVSPHGAGLLDDGASSFTATAACFDSGGGSTPCGTITWASHGTTNKSGGGNVAVATVTSGGLVTWSASAQVTSGNFQNGIWQAVSAITATVAGTCNGSSTSCADFMIVQGQHAGDAWNILVTPGTDIFTQWYGTPPLTVVLNSKIILGQGFTLNGGSQANPTQTCNWTANNGNFTIDRLGFATAVSTATAGGVTTFTCNQSGNAVTSGGSTTQTLTAIAPTNPTPKTYYAGPSGGTPPNPGGTGQCTGLVDAPYPGTGTNQPCRFHNYEDAYADGVTHLTVGWILNGGDTYIVEPGATYDAACTTSLSAPTNFAGTATCDVPNVPSGPDAAHKTRILGSNFASCSSPSSRTPITLLGREAIMIMTTQNVDIECLKLIPSGVGIATEGIWQSSLTSNAIIKNVEVTGMFSGINGPAGDSWLLDQSWIHINSGFGVNMDGSPVFSGVAYSNIDAAGNVTMNNTLIENIGCSSLTTGGCNTHDNGNPGSPDGFSVGNIVGTAAFDHDIWRYNMEDGLDTLHALMQKWTVTNSQSYGNIGQQYKMGPSLAGDFRNNFMMNNCNRMLIPFSGVTYAASGATGCRAGGAGLNPGFSNGVYNFQSNTLIGVGNYIVLQGCTYGWNCFDSTQFVTWQDNLALGYQGTATAYQQSGGTIPPMFGAINLNDVFNHNDYFNVSQTGTLGTGDITTDPLLVGEVAAPPGTTLVGNGETVLDAYNYNLTTSSPTKWTGVTYTNMLSTDQAGTTWHSPPSMGALEFTTSPVPTGSVGKMVLKGIFQ